MSERTVRVGGKYYEPTPKGRLREVTDPKEILRRTRISETVRRQYASGVRAKVPRIAVILTHGTPAERAARRAAGETDYPEVEPMDLGIVTDRQGRKAAEAAADRIREGGGYANVQGVFLASDFGDDDPPEPDWREWV